MTRFNNNAPQTTVEVTYYVRSSVLGSVVGEVNAQGQRQKGYVYANGQMLVKQWGGLLYWQQANPLTGSTRSEATAGYVYADEEVAELDPLGNDIGRTDPYAVVLCLRINSTAQVAARTQWLKLGSVGEV